VFAVVDINTLWRAKPFEALAERCRVVGLAPGDPLVWLRQRPAVGLPPDSLNMGKLRRHSVLMPPGWASEWGRWPSRRLWRVCVRLTAAARSPLEGVFVTSPHYQPLLDLAGKTTPVFYYCADDYTQYARWGSPRMRQWEQNLARRAAHSFFVSQTLADRAIRAWGAPPERVSVSPNATGQEFLRAVEPASIEAALREFPDIRRPIAGVVGEINERLDFELLLKCANLPRLGTLLFVGRAARRIADPAWRMLRARPRCVFTGPRPHAELPVWLRALDVALIPYRSSPFNRACSPMRLFDHLAASRPIVATAACAQAAEFRTVVEVGISRDDVLSLLNQELQRPLDPARPDAMRQIAMAHTWERRAGEIWNVINGCARAWSAENHARGAYLSER
jgi:glycosyltransferase involved in cell wall biosynthesis